MNNLKSGKFSITLDEWSSMKNRRYMNINIHSLSGRTFNLGVSRINGTSSAEIAAGMVLGKLQDFELRETDIAASTTDGASVMVKFGRITNYIHQQSYNHAQHLAVLDVINKKDSDEEVENDIESSTDDDDDYDVDGKDTEKRIDQSTRVSIPDIRIFDYPDYSSNFDYSNIRIFLC